MGSLAGGSEGTGDGDEDDLLLLEFCATKSAIVFTTPKLWRTAQIVGVLPALASYGPGMPQEVMSSPEGCT
jgi:hypothetical protein